MINLKLNDIDFVESAEKLGFKILQIYEFLVSRAVWSLLAWTEMRKFGYVIYEGPSSKRYSIIAAISENSLEHAAINELVFTEFIDELVKKLAERYRERRKAFILTWDGARYHSTSAVKDKFNNIGMTWVQTVPYTPEFSPIQIFNNWVKSFIRQSIRKRR